MHLEILSTKWRPFGPAGDEFNKFNAIVGNFPPEVLTNMAMLDIYFLMINNSQKWNRNIIIDFDWLLACIGQPNNLTHWGRGKMAAISQTTFSCMNTFIQI